MINNNILEIIKICFCIFLHVLVNKMHILQFLLRINLSPNYIILNLSYKMKKKWCVFHKIDSFWFIHRIIVNIEYKYYISKISILI